MGRGILTIVGVLIVGTGAAGAAPGGAGPFAFTGARLGMSLQDWRALPFPGEAAPRVQAACASDPGMAAAPALQPTAAERKAGAVVCGYVSRYGRYVLADSIRPAPGRRPVQVRYVFAGGRLSQIRYRVPRDSFDKVTARLKAAYGQPRAVVRDQVPTEIGGLDRVRMTWAGPAGTAVLTDPSDAQLHMTVALSARTP